MTVVVTHRWPRIPRERCCPTCGPFAWNGGTHQPWCWTNDPTQPGLVGTPRPTVPRLAAHLDAIKNYRAEGLTNGEIADRLSADGVPATARAVSDVASLFGLPKRASKLRCGSYSAYSKGCRCEPCTEANRRYNRTRRKQMRSLARASLDVSTSASPPSPAKADGGADIKAAGVAQPRSTGEGTPPRQAVKANPPAATLLPAESSVVATSSLHDAQALSPRASAGSTPENDRRPRCNGGGVSSIAVR